MALHAEADGDSSAVTADPNEIIARRLIVTGDVDGGYYRSCVKNEVSMPFLIICYSYLYMNIMASAMLVFGAFLSQC